MTKNHNIIEIAGELRHETEKAYLLFDGSKDVWIAKSLGERGSVGAPCRLGNHVRIPATTRTPWAA